MAFWLRPVVPWKALQPDLQAFGPETRRPGLESRPPHSSREGLEKPVAWDPQLAPWGEQALWASRVEPLLAKWQRSAPSSHLEGLHARQEAEETPIRTGEEEEGTEEEKKKLKQEGKVQTRGSTLLFFA